MQTNQNCKFILVLPPGVSDRIHPWGVHFLQQYLNNSKKFIDVDVIDLRLPEFFDKIDKNYGKILRSLAFELKDPQIQILGGAINSIGLYYCFFCSLGSEFSNIVNKYNLSRNRLIFSYNKKKYKKILEDINIEFIKIIKEKFKEQIDGENKKIIYGFSVYDNTIFNTLMIINILKKIDPDSKVILGGDYFTEHYSYRIVKVLDYIDGIILGYGEEILKEIIKEYISGNDIKHILLNGFVNRRKIGNRSENKITEILKSEIPEIPEYYFSIKGKDINRFIKREGSMIRIITQRGCSWGKCTFCNLTDRKKKHCAFKIYLIINVLNDEINNIIKGNSYNKITIHLDGDENSKESMISILELCNKHAENISINLISWFQVKICDAELGKAFANSHNNLSIFAMSNIESLNKGTLRVMKKGHLPLKGIYSSKLLMDTLSRYGTNYFGIFPMEKLKDIKEEVDIISKVIHLFMPPKCIFDIRMYMASECDEIFYNKDQNNIKIQHFPSDIWNKEIFNIDIPYSHWTFNYYENKDDKQFQRINKVMQKFINTFKDILYFKDLIETCGKNRALSLRNIYIVFIKSVYAYLLQIYFKIIHIKIKDKSYIKKFNLLIGLLKLHLKYSNIDNINENKKIPKNIRAKFYIKNNTLYKNYKFIGIKDNWKKKLDVYENELLYYLYEIRNKKQVFEYFNNKIEYNQLLNIINNHLRLGTIIESDGSYLCVANYPEYWEKNKVINLIRTIKK